MIQLKIQLMTYLSYELIKGFENITVVCEIKYC